MIKSNNAAGRLHAILDEARGYPGTERTGAVWARVLRCNPDRPTELYSGLASLGQLLGTIRKELRSFDSLNEGLFFQYFPKIEKAIAPTNLVASWKAYLPQLDDATMTSLAHCAEKLSEHRGENPLEDKELKKLGVEIGSLFESVQKSSLHPELRGTLLDILESMRRAIVEYRIRGAESLVQSLEQSLGAILLRGALFNEAKDEESVKGIMSILARMQTLVYKACDWAKRLKPVADLAAIAAAMASK